MVVAILLAVFAPGNAFLLLYGTAVASMFFVWIVVLLTHLEFRKSIPTETLASLPLKLSFHPWSTLAGLAGLLAISITTFGVDVCAIPFRFLRFFSLLNLCSISACRRSLFEFRGFAPRRLYWKYDEQNILLTTAGEGCVQSQGLSWPRFQCGL